MEDDPMTMFMNDLRGEGDRLLTRGEERELSRACEAGLLAQWMIQGNNPEDAEARKGVPYTDETMIADITGRIEDGECSPAAEVMGMIGGDGDAEDRRNRLRIFADEGDAARRRMIESNIRLVVRLAASVRNSRDIMDRIQDGALGLCHGIIKYDWRTGNRLSTYIYHWILQSMRRQECNNGRLIRIPSHVDAKIRSMRAKEAAAAVNGDTGGIDHPRAKDPETAQTMAYERLLSPVSLDSPLSSESGSTLGDVVDAGKADDADMFEEAEQARLASMIGRAVAPVLETDDGMITAMLHGFGRRRVTLGEASAITGKGRKALKTADRRGMRSLAAVLEPLALASGDYSEAELSFCFE